MDFFIKEDNIRPGNRGGRSQFKWDEVRLLTNRERESYLGATQSIGYLDRGGKWRKRDWWKNFKPDNKINFKKIQEEKEKIKNEENKLLLDSINCKYNNGIYPNNINKKLTDFQWEKVFKKESEGALKGNAINDYDFYEDENHKLGLGVNNSISFKKKTIEKEDELIQLKGIDDNNFIDKDKLLNKYIKDYIENKNKGSSKKERSRSRSYSHNKNEKKNINHKHHHK